MERVHACVHAVYTQGSGLPIIRAVSTNKNVIKNILRKKPEVCHFGGHKLKHSKRAKEWWNPNNIFKLK